MHLESDMGKQPLEFSPEGSPASSSAGGNHRSHKEYGEVLTTGQVARICRVAPRTVSKWFDTGQLRGYRIPGSKDRRIPLQHLVRFMKAHGMPLGDLDSGRTRILIVDPELELTTLLQKALSETGDYDVRVADSTLEAGALAQSFQPHVLVVNVDLAGMEGRVLTRFFAGRPELKGAQIVGMGGALTESDCESLRQQGFHQLIAKPFNIRQLSEIIERSLANPA